MTRSELARLFRRERARFTGYGAVSGAGLVVIPKPRGLPHRAMAFAETSHRHPIIGLYEPALRLPRENLLGLLRHELGHVAAPRGGEQHADDIAEAVTGRKIRYDRRGIQTIGKGRYPRPRHLHR